MADSKLLGLAAEKLGDQESNSGAQGLSVDLVRLRVLSNVAEGKPS